MKKFLILPFVLVAGNWCRRCGVLKIRHRMSDFELGKALIILLVLLVGAAAAPTSALASTRSPQVAAERYWVGGTGPVKYLQEQIGQSPFHRAGNWSDDPSTTNSLRSFGYPSTTQAATGHSGAGNAHFNANSDIAVCVVKISV